MRSTVSFQFPLQASAPNQTRPCSSSARPSSSIAKKGLAWWLVVPRRLSRTFLPGWIVSRTTCVSLAQRPARWVRR